MDSLLRFIKKFIPRRLFDALAPIYHYLLALAGAIVYRFPGRSLTVVLVTGTKGKSSTLEFMNAILEEAGHKTALVSTIRFKIGDKSEPNLFKMTLRGRFFLQRYLRRAVKAGCTHALIEMTSEGAKQYRHKWLFPDALIFTNLAREHIESHGSYEKYREAKLSIARELGTTTKPNPILVINKDDAEARHFLELPRIAKKTTYSLSLAEPIKLEKSQSHIIIESRAITLGVPGEFNIYNFLGAYVLAREWKIPFTTIKSGAEKLTRIAGRIENVAAALPEIPFSVIVDYAHTPESLESLYKAFPSDRKICVLSGTGGGRDTWKRPVMGEIADRYCDSIILTDEDSYDENPLKIVNEIKNGITEHAPIIELDRRKAIRLAINQANPSDVILLSGKGTDPYIMGPNGSKTPWSDARIAHEELAGYLAQKK